MSTIDQKMIISLESSFLFFIINHPLFYKFTNGIFVDKMYDTEKKCRKKSGITVHTFIFFIITFLTMWGSTENYLVKIKHSLYATLIFFFISSPSFAKLISVVFEASISIKHECQTLTGLLLSTLLYFLALIALMYIP